MIRNVFFDLYGTLINISTNEKAKGFFEQMELLFKEDKDLKGQFKNLYLEKCKQKQKEREEIELLDVFKEIFEVDSREASKIAITFRMLSYEKIELYPDVEWLLDTLKTKGYRLFLVSNAQSCFTNFELQALDIEKYFDRIYLSSDYGMKKPNSDFFNRPIKDFGLNPSETVMVGNDIFTDINGAYDVGINTIYVETETSTKDVVKPDVKGFDAKKILKLIRKM